MPSNYPRGSEWRKWDLHVHTPYSIVNNYGSDAESAWEEFLTDLESLPPEFKVIGVNDYLFVDGYERLLREKQDNNRIPNIDLLLPIIEFRIQMFAGIEFGSTKRINFHVIFSDEVSPDVIKSQFLAALQPSYKVSPGVDESFWSGVIDRESVADFGAKLKASVSTEELKNYGEDLVEGFRNLNVDEKEIFRILKDSSYFSGKSLTAIGKTEWDQLKWADSSIAVKKDIINKVDFVFVAAESPERYSQAREALKQNGVKHLLLDCSDAHDFSSSTNKDRIGNCWAWIKADPTFEGLRQVIYEPEERLRVQESSPIEEYPKPIFSAFSGAGPVMVDGNPEFGHVDVPLNPNLVAIIGGRGTGKSLLLDALFLTFDQNEIVSSDRLDRISPENFSVQYRKADGEEIKYDFGDSSPLDYLHVRQGDIKALVSQPDELSRQIMKLLRIELEGEAPNFDFELTELIETIRKQRRWFSIEDEVGEKVNSTEYNNKRIDENEKLIQTITTERNKELIDNYSKNGRMVNRQKDIEKKLGELMTTAASAKAELNRMVEQLNEMDIGDNLIPLLDFAPTETAAGVIAASVKGQIEALLGENDNIALSFKEQGIDQDISGLLAKVSQYRRAIDQSQSRLSEIANKEILLDQKIIKRNAYGQAIRDLLGKQKTGVDTAFARLKTGSETWTEEQASLVGRLLADIDIKGHLRFDKASFYQGLVDCLNLTRFRDTGSESQIQRVEAKLGVSNFEDFLSLLTGDSIVDNGDGVKISLDNFSAQKEFFVKCEYSIQEYVYQFRYWKRYLSVNAVINYKGKPPEKLSVGQRGTFYLSMKLATDPFGSPFVFDQPEDDLDNEFIVEELVPIFREIKKYRQVIIATHNANLVVNADAEQVIVASNDEEVLSYFSGSLENTDPIGQTGVREHVCRVLEGGRAAFEKREWKYGFRST